ncbi:hypothetical protein C8Q80DRAFT_1181222 [Daedaleopsis nitida]|nr:hypothetical protein C8Q80DRAFT_1181222 [Daedaleopsis nitida]
MRPGGIPFAAAPIPEDIPALPAGRFLNIPNNPPAPPPPPLSAFATAAVSAPASSAPFSAAAPSAAASAGAKYPQVSRFKIPVRSCVRDPTRSVSVSRSGSLKLGQKRTYCCDGIDEPLERGRDPGDEGVGCPCEGRNDGALEEPGRERNKVSSMYDGSINSTRNANIGVFLRSRDTHAFERTRRCRQLEPSTPLRDPYIACDVIDSDL